MQSRKDRLLLPPVIDFLLFLRLDQLDKVDTKRIILQVGHTLHALLLRSFHIIKS